MFFTSWIDLLRVIVMGASAYFCLVFLLRISGNRTLSKMNSFDLVITIAFGSILAAIRPSVSDPADPFSRSNGRIGWRPLAAERGMAQGARRCSESGARCRRPARPDL